MSISSDFERINSWSERYRYFLCIFCICKKPKTKLVRPKLIINIPKLITYVKNSISLVTKGFHTSISFLKSQYFVVGINADFILGYISSYF